MRETEACPHCAAGLKPDKMRRQSVHHFPSSGRIIVCVAAELKPQS